MTEEKILVSNTFCDTIDGFIRRVGLVFMWANVVVILLIILQVVLRYGFGRGLVLLEELQWHFYAVAFLMGLSYAVTTDAHVGMDLVHAKLSRKWQCLWNIFGILFLLLPFVGIVFYQSLDFVYESWRLGERSVAPMGLPYRWIIKSFMPAAFGLLVLAALSRLVRNIATLRSL